MANYKIERWDAVIPANNVNPCPMIYIKPDEVFLKYVKENGYAISVQINNTNSIYDGKIIAGVVDSSGYFPSYRPNFYNAHGWFVIALYSQWRGYPDNNGTVAIRGMTNDRLSLLSTTQTCQPNTTLPLTILSVYCSDIRKPAIPNQQTCIQQLLRDAMGNSFNFNIGGMKITGFNKFNIADYSINHPEKFDTVTTFGKSNTPCKVSHNNLSYSSKNAFSALASTIRLVWGTPLPVGSFKSTVCPKNLSCMNYIGLGEHHKLQLSMSVDVLIAMEVLDCNKGTFHIASIQFDNLVFSAESNDGSSDGKLSPNGAVASLFNNEGVYIGKFINSLLIPKFKTFYSNMFNIPSTYIPVVQGVCNA